MTSDLFIWIYLPGEAKPVVAGKLSIAEVGMSKVGTFLYGKSYLQNPAAIAIDPVTLPLNASEFKFNSLSGYPGAILDSCPDKWGIKVINRLHGGKDFPRDYLLRNDPGRSGCLAFSRDHSIPPIEMSSRQFSLGELLIAAQDVLNNNQVDEELLKALHPGTGGANPKCNIEKDDSIWIAKFPTDNSDNINIPRLEHASMLLAKECGINVAETDVATVDGKDVLLVKRFDRVVSGNEVHRISFISARSIFFAEKNSTYLGGSYFSIARNLGRYLVSNDEKTELYKRMVFNCAIRNSDDHELNHGLLWVNPKKYTLSPAFDVLPKIDTHTKIHSHALQIGDTADGTVENLLSNCEAFGLTKQSAMKIINDIEKTIKDKFHEIFYLAGFDDREIRQVEDFFKPIPLERDSTPSFMP